MQRGYISCCRTGVGEGLHPACFKYRRVVDFESHLHCGAWLLAWDLGAPTCMTKDLHRGYEPPYEVVQRALAVVPL